MEKQENEIIRLMRPIRLSEVADGIEADLILGVLTEQGIAAYKRPLESGGIMNTYMGFSIFGAEIFVDEDDYEAAKALLDEIQFVEDEIADNGEEDEYTEDENAGDEETEEDDDEDQNDDGANPINRQLFQMMVFVIIAGILLWVVSVIGALAYELIRIG